MSLKKLISITAQLTSAIDALVAEKAGGPIIVGFSGGMDSTVLLHCAARSPVARARGLRALHVHHGLQPEADAWAEHARAVAAQLLIPIDVVHVQVDTHGRGLEAAAREARLAAFEQHMPHLAWVLFAHHREDQAETVLLRLARGAALDGVAAMRRYRPFARGWLGRPWLDRSRADLHRCAEELHLSWIEDPSNQSPRHDRVYLRQSVWPLLESRFPAISERLARFAAHAQSAQSELDQLALCALREAQGGDHESISITALLGMSDCLFGLCVRRYALDRGAAAPGFHELARLRSEVLLAAVDANPRLRWLGFEFRRYRDRLYLLPEFAVEPAPEGEIQWPAGAPVCELPGTLGQLHCMDANGVESPAPNAVSVRFRIAGERLRPLGSAHARELRLLFQEHAVPTWQRPRIPLIFHGNSLLCAVGIAASEEFQTHWLGHRVRWAPADISTLP